MPSVSFHPLVVSFLRFDLRGKWCTQMHTGCCFHLHKRRGGIQEQQPVCALDLMAALRKYSTVLDDSNLPDLPSLGLMPLDNMKLRVFWLILTSDDQLARVTLAHRIFELQNPEWVQFGYSNHHTIFYQMKMV